MDLGRRRLRRRSLAHSRNTGDGRGHLARARLLSQGLGLRLDDAGATQSHRRHGGDDGGGGGGGLKKCFF